MKRKLLLGLCLSLSVSFAKAQWANNSTWDYSFGTGTGTFNTAGNSTSNATTAGFLPVTPSSSNAGVYLNTNAASGSFTLNSDNTLTQKLPTASFGRFSVNSVGSATDVVANTFKIKFSAAVSTADAGNYIYAIGNHKGNLFNITSNNSVFRSSTELFTALRWSLNATANSTVITFAYREKSTDTDAGTQTYTTINTTTFAKGGEYDVAVYCNNSSSSTIYTIAATPYTLPSNSFHIWVNGTKIGGDFARSIEEDINNTTSAVTSVALANGAALNSFLFSANGAAGATGSITLTNPKLIYSVSTTPVSFTSFTGKKAANGIVLNWATAAEQNSSYFEVLRSADGQSFNSIGTVKGKGTTNQASQYSLTDANPVNGANYYRLKQVDFDGTSAFYNDLVALDYSLTTDNFIAYATESKLNVGIYATTEGPAEISVVDLKGSKLISAKVNLKAGQNSFSLDAANLNKGVFIARITGTGVNKAVKFIK